MKKIILLLSIVIFTTVSFAQDELTTTKLTINKSINGGELLKFNTERPWVFKTIGTGPATTLRLNTISNGKNFEITNLDGTSKTAIFHVNDDLESAKVSLVPYGGRVGIGTTDPKAKLSVNGIIISSEIVVLADISQYPDFVFSDDYKLRSLKEVEEYIENNSHLPDIPEADDVKEGIALGEMNNKLLQKIEELTLYTIEQEKKIEKLEKLVGQLINQTK